MSQRKGYTKPITANVQPELAAWVKEQAKRKGTSVSAYVEGLLLVAAQAEGAFAPKAEEYGDSGVGESVPVREPGVQEGALDAECGGGGDTIHDQVSGA